MKTLRSIVKRASRSSNLFTTPSMQEPSSSAATALAVVPVVDEDNTIEFKGDPVVEDRGDFETVKVLVTWSLPQHKDQLTSGDRIIILPSDKEYDEDCAYGTQLFAYASGQHTGKVYISITGFGLDPAVQYVAIYVQVDTKQALARSTEVKQFSAELLQTKGLGEEAKAASEQANYASTMQHITAAVASTAAVNEMENNPLLSVTPQVSEYDALLQQRKERFLKKKQQQDEVQVKEESVVSGGRASTVAVDVTPLSSQDLVGLVQQSFDQTPGFVFAGAGVSMAAPSSSPSWWTLMNDLLEATFDAVPEELADLRRVLTTGDVSRQPEEIMESFYFFLQDRLLSVFELLEHGEPNANHVAIAKLAKQGKLRAVLTTNFDLFIERALQAENVPYRLVVTAAEFTEYLTQECREFAVLKIHGTMDRPETVVAVANHYKSGKGFALEKQRVLSYMLTHSPTLFLGYSGWDFEHTNYQEFWSAQPMQGLPVYWLKALGASGGPNLKLVLGKHIGSRLQVGEGTLPSFACEVLQKWDVEGSSAVLSAHAKVDAKQNAQEIAGKRAAFLKRWVGEIPKPKLVALLQMEVSVLNKKSQDRKLRKKNQFEADNQGPVDNAAMYALQIQLGTEMAEGKLTYDEYMDQIQLHTMDAVFTNIVCSREKKNEFKRRFIAESKTNPLFVGEVVTGETAMNKALLPGLLASCVEGLPETASADEIFNEALKYLEKLTQYGRLAAQGDERAAAMKQMYMVQSHYLRCEPAVQVECEEMIAQYVDDGIKAGKTLQELIDGMTKEIGTKITNMAFGLIDIKPLIAYQFAALEHNASNKDEFVDNALCTALSLQRSAIYLVGDLAQLPEYSQLISVPLNSGEKKLPEGNVEKFAKLCMEQGFNPPQALLEKLSQHGGKAVIRAFQLASLELLYEALKNSSTARYIDTQTLQRKGYYAKEILVPQFTEYALPQLKQLSASVDEDDERNAQRLFGVLTLVAEGADDIDALKFACERSLKLTGNRVTELTPVGIPESYAYALQCRGKLEDSLKLYVKALDGIKQSVVRSKADGIVLQACLVQAQFDKQLALKMAFEYSPYFSSSAQQFATAAEGRQLLVQQCKHWATVDLGFSSLDEAETALSKHE